MRTYAVHFCGVGGACKGLHDAGLECVLAIDKWQPALDIREKNLGHKGLCMDAFDYKIERSHAADLLWTSPVCQTFSASSREFQTIEKSDIRDDLYMASVNYCKEFKPKFFVLENVVGLLSHQIDKLGSGTLQRIKKSFTDIGYRVEVNVLDTVDWGLPQYRERLFVVGSIEGKKGLLPKKPKLLKPPTLEGILEHGITDRAWSGPTYKTAMNKVERTNVTMRVMLPDDIFPTITCGWAGGATRKKVCIVDKTKDGVEFLRHPTLLEATKAQGFPSSWEWPNNSTDAWTMLGNSVSPIIAKAIIDHLKLVDEGKNPPSAVSLHNPNSIHLKRGGHVPKYVSEMGEDMPPEIDYN